MRNARASGLPGHRSAANGCHFPAIRSPRAAATACMLCMAPRAVRRTGWCRSRGRVPLSPPRSGHWKCRIEGRSTRRPHRLRGESPGRRIPPRPQNVDHALGAGHNPGHAAEPGIQLGLVRFPLGGEGSDRAGALRPGWASKSVTIPPPRQTYSLPRPGSQLTSVSVWTRRSFPDGVFGIVPGSSTTTLRGRTSTSATTSCAT